MQFVLITLGSALLIPFLIVLSRFFLVGTLSPTSGKNVFQIVGKSRQLWYGSGGPRYRCRHCRRYRVCERGESTHA